MAERLKVLRKSRRMDVMGNGRVNMAGRLKILRKSGEWNCGE